MPASPSANRAPNSASSRGRKPTARAPVAPARRRIWPWVLLGVLVILGIALAALPASLLNRALPPQVQADDFSGSVWHGSAGKIIFNGKDVGALEWHLHPLPLLTLSVEAELHWVKLSTVMDGLVRLNRTGLTASHVKGTGSLEDLADVGMPRGWRGSASVTLDQLRTDYRNILAAIGTLSVNGVSSPQVAGGSDLGNYELRLAPDSIAADGTLTVALNDLGGPLELQAQIRVPPGTRTGTLTGVLKERAAASAALRDQISSLAQMRPRDAAGRIPIDLEFTL
jgi:general secretion pathway protein N